MALRTATRSSTARSTRRSITASSISPFRRRPARTPVSNEITTKDQFERVFEAIRGLQTVQAISLGLELGLFSALNQTPMTPAELAAHKGLHEPYVRVWCEAAYAFGLLEISDGHYVLAPKMDVVLLDSDHPRYLG